MIKHILSVLLLCAILFLVCGCSEYLPESEAVSSGEPLTPEYMAEISQKLAEEQTTTLEASSEDSALEIEDSSTLEVDDSQTEGNSVAQAISTSQQTDSDTTSDEIIVSVVYWTESGSVWHNKKDCSALARSKIIMSGSTHDAVEAGKERVCKRCG